MVVFIEVDVVGDGGGFVIFGGLIVPSRYLVAPFSWIAILICLLQATQLVLSNLLSSVKMVGAPPINILQNVWGLQW